LNIVWIWMKLKIQGCIYRILRCISQLLINHSLMTIGLALPPNQQILSRVILLIIIIRLLDYKIHNTIWR
jgi:hypothetical protein